MPPPFAEWFGPAFSVPLPVSSMTLPSGAVALSLGVVAPMIQAYVAWLPLASVAPATLCDATSPARTAATDRVANNTFFM